MKRSISIILLITILLSTLSLSSCFSGAQGLERKLEEMGFVENPDEAKERAKNAINSNGTDKDIFITLLEARGSYPRLWQKGDDFVIFFECRDIETAMVIKYGSTEATYDQSDVNELEKAGRLYLKCYVLSAPDYVYNEIAKMNGFI